MLRIPGSRLGLAVIGLLATFFGCSMAAFADEPLPSRPEQTLGASGPYQMVKVIVGDTVVSVPFKVTPNGLAIVEGDIVLGPVLDVMSVDGEPKTLQSFSGFEMFGLFQLSRRLWPHGVVKYSINPSIRHPDRVNAAIQHWESKTKIRFEKAGPNDVAFVEFVGSSDRGECTSAIGYSARKQNINLGADCSTGNIIHEIGHAVGIAHEQMRSDQSKYIKIYYDNIISGYADEFKPKPWSFADSGEYCYGSIMHYKKNQFALPGTTTIKPIKGNPQIGQRNGLASCDIELVNREYASEFARH